MKKTILALLLAATALLSASCSRNDPPPSDTQDTTENAGTGGTAATDTTAPVEEAKGYEGSLSELADEIYKKVPVELSVGTDKIDISNSDNVKYYLGLTSADSIEEAVFSEPMINAQAYSLCLVRAKAGADIHTMVKDIFENVNTRKWVCVEADDLIVGNSGDIIMLIMTDSGFGDTLASDLYNAFTEIVGADGEKLSK